MTALGTVIGVPDILNQATTAQSFSGNASPLMIAAIIYVVIFLPLVVASLVRRKVPWKGVGMSGFIEQFLNIQIMAAAWPTLMKA